MENFPVKIKAVRRPPNLQSLISTTYHIRASSFVDIINKVLGQEVSCGCPNTLVYIELNSSK